MSNTVVLQVFGCFRRSLLQMCKVYQNLYVKIAQLGPPGARWITAAMILVSLFSFNMFQPSSSTRSTKEKHIFDLVTAVPVTTQPTATTTIKTHTAWLATSWTQVVTYALERGAVERSCCDPWISKQFGKGWGGERDFLDDFVGIPIGRIHGTGSFTPTFNPKKSTQC